MLKTLNIENYILIDKLKICFSKGLTIITGETGAGKSVILGALSLLMGQRSDPGVIKDKSRKCFIEGLFEIGNYELKDFFSENELDYYSPAIIRREILPEGKSRAFINDTPVNLNLLKVLCTKLIDIHSQHESLLLADNSFQLKVVDTVADHPGLLEEYRTEYDRFNELEKQKTTLEELALTSRNELGFITFRLDQLNAAKLNNENEQQELEAEYEMLTHSDEIRTALNQSSHILNGDEESVLHHLKNIRNSFVPVIPWYAKAKEISDRLESIMIELKDISTEVETQGMIIEYDPVKAQQTSERLNLIYELQQKNHVSTIAELIQIRKKLENDLHTIMNFDHDIEVVNSQITRCREKMKQIAGKISANRKKVIPGIEGKITGMLANMGMPASSLKIQSEILPSFSIHGTDRISFLFSANRNVHVQEISRVASGGEISRVMLAVKAMLSNAIDLPTIVFDEIDTGVSGDVADKVGNILKNLAEFVQVINITHLPQIAAKADDHFLVYKTDDGKTTRINIRQLDKNEKMVEIARMLSGNELTEAAMLNARELLKN